MKKAVLAMVLGVTSLGTASPLMAANLMLRTTSDDVVGQSIIYNLRNEIARSGRHKVVYTDQDAGFIIDIITLKDNDGRSTVYTAALLMPNKKGFDYYVTGVVGHCGSDVTASCSSKIMASLDSSISEVVTAFTQVLKDRQAAPANH